LGWSCGADFLAIQGIARAQEACIEWVPGAESQLLADLDERKLDLVIGANAVGRRGCCASRESGHVLSGEVFVVPGKDVGVVSSVTEAAEALRALDWRLYNLVVVPVSDIETEEPHRT
jgi:hypothetical protein